MAYASTRGYARAQHGVAGQVGARRHAQGRWQRGGARLLAPPRLFVPPRPQKLTGA